MDFYKEQRWEELRLSILRRDKYICQVSKRYGKIRQAEIVHHVFPREEFPEYEYTPWNLVAITRRVHKDLHDQNTGELTEEGRILLINTARKNGVEIPEKYKRPIRKAMRYDRRNIY